MGRSIALCINRDIETRGAHSVQPISWPANPQTCQLPKTEMTVTTVYDNKYDKPKPDDKHCDTGLYWPRAPAPPSTSTRANSQAASRKRALSASSRARSHRSVQTRLGHELARARSHRSMGTHLVWRRARHDIDARNHQRAHTRLMRHHTGARISPRKFSLYKQRSHRREADRDRPFPL